MELVNPFLILLINLLLSTTAVFSKYDIIMEPIHYNIKLMPRMDDDSFHGESNVSINIYNPTQNITISSEKVTIIEFVLINELRGSKNNDGKSAVHTPKEYFYNYETNTYRFYFYNVITPGNYTVNMKFIGTIAEDFRIFHKDEQGFRTRILAMIFQRTEVQQIFPCLEAPALMTTFNISVRHHKYYTILSNMPVREKHTDNNEMMWTHFQTTPVMSTYHVAVVMLLNYTYNYDLNQTNQTVNVWFRSHLLQYIEFVHRTAKNIMQYLDLMVDFDKWKLLEKIPKVDFIGIPEFEEHNIVIPGLIFYRERDIMYNKECISQQSEVAHLIVQKLIQERFYNKFGTSQTDLWLNGVIRFLGAYILDKISRIHYMDLFVVQIQHDSLHLDINYNMTPLTTQVDNFSPISYYLKAPCIIRMLQHVLTEKVFLNGIRIFLEDDTNQKDFWTCVQNAIDKSDLYIYTYKFSVQVTWMKTWAMGYPVQNVMSNKEYCINKTVIKIWQDRAPNESAWWIPVTSTTQKSPDFSKSWFKDDEWLSRSRPILYWHTEKTGWIIVNLQQSGYYRVYYDYKNWQQLVNYLDSEEYRKIHVLNRAQIIDDAFHFVLEDRLLISVFLNLTKYLSREINYIAWYPMIRAFQNMSTFFPLPEKKVDIIKEKLQGILNKLLTNIGYEQKTDMDDLTKCLIEEATKWACVIGSTNCKNKATIKLQWHLENSNQRLSPHWKEWTYCKGLMAANMSIWYDVLEKYEKKYDNVLLEYLTCSENPDSINNYLNLLRYKYIDISDHIRIKTVHLIVSKHARKNNVLKYIIENFKLLRFRQINVLTTIAIIINHVYSEEQIEMLRSFVLFKLTERPLFMHDQHEEHMGKLLNATKTEKVVEGRHFVYILNKMKERLSQIANQIHYLDTLILDE